MRLKRVPLSSFRVHSVTRIHPFLPCVSLAFVYLLRHLAPRLVLLRFGLRRLLRAPVVHLQVGPDYTGTLLNHALIAFSTVEDGRWSGALFGSLRNSMASVSGLCLGKFFRIIIPIVASLRLAHIRVDVLMALTFAAIKLSELICAGEKYLRINFRKYISDYVGVDILFRKCVFVVVFVFFELGLPPLF